MELECEGARILLDLGMPLDAGEAGDPSHLLPKVPGLQEPDGSLLALVVSHGHADHWALSAYAPNLPTVVTGAATRRILRAASRFVPRPLPPALSGRSEGPDLSDRKPIWVGPFTITPYLVDHSAYDAYGLLIKANGRRLFYTGDIRAHGRKAKLFDCLDVWSQGLMVHSCRRNGGMRYGPSSSWERHNDRGSPSSNTQ